MASDMDEQRFQAVMIAVKRHFDNEEFDEALPLVTKAHEAFPSNSAVLRSRLFTLLNLSKWAEALKVCEKYSSADEDLSFERAYCMYRLNQFQEALDILSKSKSRQEDGERLARLEAQVGYRMANYETCASMYEKMFRDDAEDTGLLVNAIASYVSGEKPEKALSLLSKHEELLESSYELCFNVACALLDEGRLKEAEERLAQAKEICVKELMQDMEEESEDALEDNEEIAAIQVQLACVQQRSGDIESAKALYEQVLKPRSGQSEVDVTVLAVACNNLVSLRPEGKSLFDSLKRINVASKESLDFKLTRKQTVEIAANKCLLLQQARRLEEARRELDCLGQSCPGHPRVAVVKAALAFKDKKAKQCEEILDAYLQEHPSHEEVILPLAQLYAQQNRHDAAVEVLAKLPLTSRAKPKTLEAIVSLHLRQKAFSKVVECLKEAITFWSSKQQEGDELAEHSLGQVLRLAARLSSQIKDQAFAAEVYKLYLEKIDGSDPEVLYGLVQALASSDPQRAVEYAQRLPVPSFDHLDPEELEQAPIPKITAVLANRKQKEKEAGEEGEDKKARRRKRKPRYPKGFNPDSPGPPPDPERWLPKRERAEYKKKMKKRDKHLFRGPQGASVASEDAFRKTGPSTAQLEASKDTTKAPRTHGRKK
jgi:signal recognition particle subunit SRP72